MRAIDAADAGGWRTIISFACYNHAICRADSRTNVDSDPRYETHTVGYSREAD
jgi:hypothetical protein